jgi:glycosyltransferase involved in cell wall biosynthesis
MNIFIIPSWYPSESQPIGGIFTKEQAEAIADLQPNSNVIVSTWGHYDGEIPVRRPWNVIKVLNWYRKQPRYRTHQVNGVWEMFTPAISWSRQLPFGGARQLMAANRNNLRMALEQFKQIDIIHAHVSYPAGFIAAQLAKEFDIPYIITEHMSPFPFHSLMKKGKPIPEIAEAFAKASATVAVSPSLADRVASFGLTRPFVTPNIVDERRFTVGNTRTEKFIFFTLCGLSEQKGIDHLLQAIALWNPPSDQFEFRIGGDGAKKSYYIEMSTKLGIADRVRWLGFISREIAPEEFKNCHAYVMPSRHETFGIVYAEAIACGKPIIATRCGGPESIVNEINGKLVEIGNVSELAKTMRWMAENHDQYKPQKIRHDFEQRFSRQAVVTQLTTLYEQVLGK